MSILATGRLVPTCMHSVYKLFTAAKVHLHWGPQGYIVHVTTAACCNVSTESTQARAPAIKYLTPARVPPMVHQTHRTPLCAGRARLGHLLELLVCNSCWSDPSIGTNPEPTHWGNSPHPSVMCVLTIQSVYFNAMINFGFCFKISKSKVVPLPPPPPPGPRKNTSTVSVATPLGPALVPQLVTAALWVVHVTGLFDGQSPPTL